MGDTVADLPTWSPSGLFEVATEVVEGAVDGAVHVRGRVVDTGASRGGTQFVTLVDEDVGTPSWDTPRLGLVVFAWRAEWFERPLGGPISEALTTGTVVDAVGELGLAPGRGGLQLRVESLADRLMPPRSLRDGILQEDWLAARPPLPPVLRRVGALISVAGDGDLDEALRLVEHDAYAPAFCRHRIHPLSATARTDVPALLDHHVRAGVDAVLIAFGGHLPEVSAWDSAEVLEAIQRAHLAGVPVVAGFAHGRDQPLTKLVAHNHAQASAAVSALVQHNHRLLGRLQPLVHAGVDQVAGATARVAGAAAATARRTLELGDPGPGLARRLEAAAGTMAGVAGRVAGDLDTTFDAAGRVPGLLRRGFALVTDDDGVPVPAAGPGPGTHVRVTTATATFGATVDQEELDG